MRMIEKIAIPLAKSTKVRRAFAKLLAKKKPKQSPKGYKAKMAKGGVSY